MRDYQFTGLITALSSISHNGGERNGNTTQLRREKRVQPDGSVEDVPVISGNGIRGIIRDSGMYLMLKRLGYGIQPDGKVSGLPMAAFHFLFGGGALTSSGGGGVDVNAMRRLKQDIPLVGVFGGAIGNSVMPGKLKVGKMELICKENNHILPEKYRNYDAPTSWSYCQTETYTRRDDSKNDRLLPMLEGNRLTGMFDHDLPEKKKKEAPQQMIYNIETIAAGAQFYWKVVLMDVTDLEFEAFISAILNFSKTPYIGGKSGVGHGEISINMDKWIEIDSRTNSGGQEVDLPLMQKYYNHLDENKADIRARLESIK